MSDRELELRVKRLEAYTLPLENDWGGLHPRAKESQLTVRIQIAERELADYLAASAKHTPPNTTSRKEQV